MIKIGSGYDGIRSNGLIINPSADCNVLWVRVPNDILETFRISPVNTTGLNSQDLGETYTGGMRSLNNIAPDGGISGL